VLQLKRDRKASLFSREEKACLMIDFELLLYCVRLAKHVVYGFAISRSFFIIVAGLSAIASLGGSQL
jgi:hypothetical protein